MVLLTIDYLRKSTSKSLRSLNCPFIYFVFYISKYFCIATCLKPPWNCEASIGKRKKKFSIHVKALWISFYTQQCVMDSWKFMRHIASKRLGILKQGVHLDEPLASKSVCTPFKEIYNLITLHNFFEKKNS